MGIFKANDVRGIYPKELNESKSYLIAQSFAKFIRKKKILIAQDNRLSSPSLRDAIVQGLVDFGIDVIDLGLVDSPAFYFASSKLKVPGIMITASHNPPNYNGFYFVNEKSCPIYKKNGLEKIRKIFERSRPLIKSKKGRLSTIEFYKEYKKMILSFMKYKIIPLKIVVDTGNGTGKIPAKIFEEFSQIKLTKQFFNLDGRYPNHGPDPTIASNLAPLQSRVIKEKADFGVIFDADADRVAFVDEQGKIVQGSIAGALILDFLLQKRKNEKIVCSIGCTKTLREIIERHNSLYIREKVGHSFISDHMRRVKAFMGIEQTGHFFYKHSSYAENPMITSLVLCHIISQKNKKLSELLKPYQKYYMTQEINFPVDNAQTIIPKLKNKLAKLYRTKIDNFDGLYIETPELWFRIRPSQTEPALRLTLEGKSKSQVDAERKKLEIIIREVMKE